LGTDAIWVGDFNQVYPFVNIMGTVDGGLIWSSRLGSGVVFNLLYWWAAVQYYWLTWQYCSCSTCLQKGCSTFKHAFISFSLF